MKSSGQGEDGKRDLEFVRRVLARAPEALAEFAERMIVATRHLAALNLVNGHPLQPADLEDAAQSVREKVWRKLPSFEGRSRFETWVGGFCVNEFRTMRKRLENHGGGPIDPEDPRGGAVLEPYESNLERYLRHLSPKEATVVRLHLVEDRKSVV